MGKVQTYLSQVNPSGSIGGALISNPASIARTGEEQVYGAMGDLAGIAQEMMEKSNKLNDSTSDAKTTQIMKQAELEYQTKIEADGNTENYEKYRTEAIMKAQSQIGQLKYKTSQGKTKNGIETKFWTESFTTTSKLNAFKQNAQDSLAATEAAYEIAITTDNGTPESTQKVAMAKTAFESALSTVHSPEYVKAKMYEVHLKHATSVAQSWAFAEASSVDPETGQIVGFKGVLKKLEDPVFVQELIDKGVRPEDVPTIVESMKKMAKLGEENKAFLADADKNSILSKLDSKASTKPEDRPAKANEMRTFLETSNIVGDDRKEWLNYINDYESGKSINPTTKILAEDIYNAKAYDVYLGKINREDYIAEVNNATVAYGWDSSTREKLLKKMDAPLDGAPASAIKSKVYEVKSVLVASTGTEIDPITGNPTGLAFFGFNDKQKEELAGKLKWVNMYSDELEKWVLEHKGELGANFERFSAERSAYYQTADYEETIAKKVKENDKERLSKYKKGDTKYIGGKKYTYNGKDWD
jgi:hypothetical protein